MKQKIITTDSFYNNSTKYLNAADSDNQTYLIMKKGIEARKTEDSKYLNSYIIGNILATNRDCYETSEEVSDAFKLIVAALYIVCVDEKIVLKPSDPLKSFKSLQEAISSDLNEVVGVEMAGEIMSFIENYSE